MSQHELHWLLAFAFPWPGKQLSTTLPSGNVMRRIRETREYFGEACKQRTVRFWNRRWCFYLGKLPRLEKKLRVALDWTLDLLFSKDLVQFQSFRHPRPAELPEAQMRTELP